MVSFVGGRRPRRTRCDPSITPRSIPVTSSAPAGAGEDVGLRSSGSDSTGERQERDQSPSAPINHGSQGPRDLPGIHGDGVISGARVDGDQADAVVAAGGPGRVVEDRVIAAKSRGNHRVDVVLHLESPIRDHGDVAIAEIEKCDVVIGVISNRGEHARLGEHLCRGALTILEWFTAECRSSGSRVHHLLLLPSESLGKSGRKIKGNEWQSPRRPPEDSPCTSRTKPNAIMRKSGTVAGSDSRAGDGGVIRGSGKGSTRQIPY